MEQHPIPQQISSYEFKLVGEMTLKQFLKAGAGILLAIIINALPIVTILKWPLILLVAGTGIEIAFVPFNDRPLEVWIGAFVKAIYKPTIYLYKRSKRRSGEEIEIIHKNMDLIKNEPEAIANTEKKEKVKKMIESIPGVEMAKKADSKAKITDMKILEEGVNKDKEAESSMVKEDNWRQNKVDLKLKTEKLGATGNAVFGEIPMPDIPDVPNVIVGMVTDKKGSIMEGAIVEIQDKNGNPARVLKTNSLGQFRTTTPLASGKYLIIPEKDNFDFDRVEINLEGKIVQPIKIQSTS